MEQVVNCFFEEVLENFDRGSLYARVKRRQLCEYLYSMIRNCSTFEDDVETNCEKAVLAALGFHGRSKAKNGGICLMGKYHNVLYIAARLAFLFRLDSNPTVVELLHAIFDCEGSFERIVSGAIFGPTLSGTISGWKSEFDSREECVEALNYFLSQACRARAEFGNGLRMADVPLATASRSAPAALALQARRPDVFRLLLHHGAQLHFAPQGAASPLEVLSDLREDSWGGEQRVAECLALGAEVHPGGCGWPLLSLKGLARLALRERLAVDFILPDRLVLLRLPPSILSYIRLEPDSSMSSQYNPIPALLL